MTTSKVSRSFVLMAAICLLALPVRAQPFPGGESLNHSSATGTFSVSVPLGYSVQPSVTESEPTDLGPIVFTTYLAGNDFQTIQAYSLIHWSFPPGYDDGRTIPDRLAFLGGSMVQGMDGAITAQRAVSLGTYIGLEIDFGLITSTPPGFGQGRLFWLGNELVAVIYLGQNPFVYAETSGRQFMESLSYVPGAVPIPTPTPTPTPTPGSAITLPSRTGTYGVTVPEPLFVIGPTISNSPGASGPMTITQYVANSDFGQVASYQIMYLQDAALGSDPAYNTAYFESFVGGAAGTMGGTAITQHPDTFAGLEGIAFEYYSATMGVGPGYVCGRAFRSGNDVVTLMVMTRTLPCGTIPNVAAFLNSMTLTP
jgi:hypothetical protein